MTSRELCMFNVLMFYSGSLYLFVFSARKQVLDVRQGSGGQWKAVLASIYVKHVEILYNIFTLRLDSFSSRGLLTPPC